MFKAREEQFLDTIGPPPVGSSACVMGKRDERTAACSELSLRVSACREGGPGDIRM
jgi:hypothetical protein